jgi:hypothetical protein
MSLLGIDPANPDEFKGHQETLFDGPLLPEQDAAVGRGAKAKKPKKASKKHVKKGRSLRDMAFETMSPSNVITRDDMARGAHKPEPLGAVLDGLFGLTPSDPIVATEALAIITEFGNGIRTGITEWRIIQDMVERAYRAGYNDGQARAR